MLYTVYHISSISLLFAHTRIFYILIDVFIFVNTHIRTYTSYSHFRHMNMHENYMPNLIFTLPELKTNQIDELLIFLWKFSKMTKNMFIAFLVFQGSSSTIQNWISMNCWSFLIFLTLYIFHFIHIYIYIYLFICLF